jgi:hypothetical protein
LLVEQIKFNLIAKPILENGEVMEFYLPKGERLDELAKQAKEMEDEQLLEYWKGGIQATEEGGVSFDVYHNGDGLASTDMAAMYKQMKMEVNVSETQEYYKSKEVQDLDKAIDLVDEYEKIELTPDELLNLLKEAYRNGYATYELVDAELEHYDAYGYARWVLLGLK